MSAGADEGPVAIICGGGSLPMAVADAASRSGRKVVLFPVHGWADQEALSGYRQHWLRLASAGRFRRLARAEGCRDVVMIGSAVRPAIRELRIDWLTVRLLPRFIRLYRGGDDQVLRAIAGLLEEHGFHLVGAHEFLPDLLLPEGPLGIVEPSARDEADIARGMALIDAIGPFDVGQAAIVAENLVLAVEASEGTDRMLDRVADLRKEGRIRLPDRVGVLIKAPKPMQDRRIDMPAIGPQTVAKAQRAGLAGIAAAAGETIVAMPQQVAAEADRAGLFVVGVRAGVEPRR